MHIYIMRGNNEQDLRSANDIVLCAKTNLESIPSDAFALDDEVAAFYLAIEVLIPWGQLREQLLDMHSGKQENEDLYQIAKAFMIPQGVIEHIFLGGNDYSSGSKESYCARSWRINRSLFVRQSATPVTFAGSSSWVILSPIERSIKAKIEKVGVPLKDWDVNIYRGILTGYNDAFIIGEEKRNEILSNCADASERKRTDELIRPILRGRDIKRYAHEWAGQYLIATHNGIPEKDIPKIDISKFSSLKKHLDAHWTQIEKRSDQGDTPYHLRSCAYWEDFSKPKIVWAELARTGNAFTFDANKHFIGNTGYILTISDEVEKTIGYELLLAFLNSKAILFYLDMICSRFDENGWRWLRQFVELLPVPKIEKARHDKLLKLVASELQTKTRVGQAHIENYVAELFGLTDLERNHLRETFIVLDK